MLSQRDVLLKELLGSAQTPADLEAVQQLLTEAEAAEKGRERFLLRTLSEVAEFFGLDEHTLRVWRLRTPPMPGDPGKWPLKEIVQWRCAWLQQSDIAAAKRQQEYELGQIKLEREQMELARERGEMLLRSDVELWAATAIVEFREAVMRLPEILAAAVGADQKAYVRAEVERHCVDVLTATQHRMELAQIRSEVDEA